MPKVTLNDMTSGYNSSQQFNANNTIIETAFDNTVSRDGSSPNTMSADFDLNNNDILNAKDVYSTNLYIGGSAVSLNEFTASNLAVTKEFLTVTAMLADTGVYTTDYVAGNYFRVVDGNYVYKVAASGASDEHLTTAGGVKLYVQPGASGYNVKAFNAKGDGVTDDTTALLAFAAADSEQKVMPEGTYVWDGSDLEFGDGFTLLASGAVLKLKAGTYSGNFYGVCNRNDVTYSGATSRHTRIRVVGLKIDGNTANVTHTGSMAGLYFHQCDDVIVDGVEVADVPGSTNGLAGLSFRFCRDVAVRDYRSTDTGRQGVLFWETTGRIFGGNIGYSREREAILISGENIADYQGSEVTVENVTMDNSATTNGTHVVRFSGLSSGVVRGCDITGDSALNGIYVTFASEHDVTVEDTDIRSCLVGLKVDTNGTKRVRSIGNRYHSCTDGVDWNASGTDTLFISSDDDFISTTTQPLDIDFCEDVLIEGVRIDGGNTANLLSNFNTLRVVGCLITGMTSATYSVNINTVASGSALPIFSSNILEGNTADVVTSNEDVIAEANDVSGMLGTGIKLGRIGRSFVWEDTGAPGTLYTKTTLPTTLTDGTVIGSQT